MTDWFGLATLVAAVAAAVLSAASFFFSGRREDLRWKREVLEETMVSLLDASYDSIDTAALAARHAGEDLSWRKDRALDAHDLEMRAITRLRFLAKPVVVKRAFELHQIERKIYDAVFRNDVELDATGWDELVHRRRIARDKLFDAARRDLGLRRSPDPQVGPYEAGGPTAQDLVAHEMKRQRSSERSDQPRP
jgi:hypothetical protein